MQHTNYARLYPLSQLAGSWQLPELAKGVSASGYRCLFAVVRMVSLLVTNFYFSLTSKQMPWLMLRT